jgi:hypothetical protein
MSVHVCLYNTGWAGACAGTRERARVLQTGSFESHAPYGVFCMLFQCWWYAPPTLCPYIIQIRAQPTYHSACGALLSRLSPPISPLPSLPCSCHPIPSPTPIPPSPRHSLALSHATTLSCCGGNRASSYKLQRGQGAYARRNIAHATRAHPLPAKCHKGQLVLSLYHPFDTSRSSRRNEACGGGGRGCGHG